VDIIWIANDNLLRLRGLKNKKTGAYENSAVVTARIVNSGGSDVVGQGWPVTLTYVANSNGDYDATLEDALVLTNLASYTAKVWAVSSGLQGYWAMPIVAKDRAE